MTHNLHSIYLPGRFSVLQTQVCESENPAGLRAVYIHHIVYKRVWDRG